jgi:hypothetical protein
VKKIKNMKNWLLVGLMFSSYGVLAEEWQMYFESDKFYFFIAPNSTLKTGANIVTSTTHDYKTASERGERSRQITREYDCVKAQSRVLRLVTYSQEKAAGEVIRDEPQAEAWSSIPANSAVSALGNIVCSAS